MVDERIKVLRIITRLNVGGPSRQIDSLIEYLDVNRFHHIIAMGEVEDDEIEHLVTSRSDIDFRRISELGRSVSAVSDLKALIHLIKLIHTERPHIVHTHLAKAGVLGRLAAWLNRVPIRIHTFHGHLLNGYFGGARLRLYILTERLLKLFTTFQICIGERVRQDLISARIVSPDSSIAMAPGIQSPKLMLRDDARRELGIDSTAVVVLFVGRLVQVKRVDRFVRAINAVSAHYPNVMALIVGDGPERIKAEKEIEDPRYFAFAGWQEDLSLYYSSADLVCLTSDNEGMPITLIEAGLCGIATVTTDAGSAREIVLHNETGAVVPADDFSQLVEVLLELIADNDKRVQFGAAAKTFSETTFGGKRLAEDHARLYEQMMVKGS